MLEARKTWRDHLSVAVALLLAFLICLFVGHEEPEEKPPEPPCPVSVCECGTPPQPAPKIKAARKPKRKVKTLPEAPGPPDDEGREKLLAWVRRKAGDLTECRKGDKEVHRLAVTLLLGDDGNVTRVQLSTAKGEVPPKIRRCLRERIVSWKIPAGLTADKREVMFGLSI